LPDDETNLPRWLTVGRASLDVVRDTLLLLLVVLLLLAPGCMGDLMIRAGITHASILGIEWEQKVDEAEKNTAAAQEQVERLNEQLTRYADQVEQISTAVTAAKATEVKALAGTIRASKSVAAEVSAKLGRNLATQRELKAEIRSRVPTGSH
jgi:hypothetical protein